MLQACFARGLNALDVDEASLRRYLNDWIQITCNIDGNLIHFIILWMQYEILRFFCLVNV